MIELDPDLRHQPPPAPLDRLKRVLDLFRAAGCEVSDALVRFDPDFLVEQAARAAREFDMRARNPAYDLHIGGEQMIFAPTTSGA